MDRATVALRTRLAALVVLLGIVLLPVRAVAATIPVLIAYDAPVRPTATTRVETGPSLRTEPGSAYDDAPDGHDGGAKSRLADATGAVCGYDDALNLAERPEFVEGVNNDVSAATTAAEGAAAVRPLVYGPSAGGQLAATAERLGGETLTALEKPAELGWEAFSKQTLDAAASSGRPVIFDLTHVQDLPGVLNGTGRFANTVTGAELRYIQANWARFQGNVTFIGGGVPW